MADIFNNPIDRYKNFNMVHELDIAGTFIYNGVRALDEVEYIKYVGDVFSFLYPIAVGIERLQKVLLVVVENITIDEINEFEKGLITHSHQELHNRIRKKCNIKFNSRENGFLQVLSKFYNSCRYNRFIHTGDIDKEKKILIEYIQANIDESCIFKGWNEDEIINTEKIKEFFGRVIGSISKQYYEKIYESARERGIYSYEVRSSDSKAARVFLNTHKKNSLYQQIKDEENALKEIMIYLITERNNDDDIYRLIDYMETLNLDSGFIKDCLPEVFKRNIPQELIDYIKVSYSYCKEPRERENMIMLFGDSARTRAFFDSEYEIDEIEE